MLQKEEREKFTSLLGYQILDFKWFQSVFSPLILQILPSVQECQEAHWIQEHPVIYWDKIQHQAQQNICEIISMESLYCTFLYFTYSCPRVSRNACFSIFTAKAKRSLFRWNKKSSWSDMELLGYLLCLVKDIKNTYRSSGNARESSEPLRSRFTLSEN